MMMNCRLRHRHGIDGIEIAHIFHFAPPPHRTLSLYTIHSTDNEFVPHLLHEKSYWYQFRFRFPEFNMQTKHTDFSTCMRSEGGQKTKQNEMK